MVALIAVTGLLATSLAATAQTDQALRILARHLEDGRVEVALQQRQEDGDWGDRLLPAQRFVRAQSRPGQWLASSPVAIDTTGGTQDVRITARRHADGRIEVALQRRQPDGTWEIRIRPRWRFVAAGAPIGRWLASSAITGGEPAIPTGDETGSATPGDDQPTTATPTSDDPDPETPTEDDPATAAPTEDDPDPQTPAVSDPLAEAAAGIPGALMTPTGVPVAVLERSGDGYLVRTPCGNTAKVADGEPIEGVRVVLDPGHGGRYEVGAVGPNGLPEDVLNLTLSEAILAELADRGIAAATTRTGDYGSLLSVRAAFADATGAEALISIHHNAPTWRLRDTPGTEVYVQSVTDGVPRPSSARLGSLLYEEITATLARFEGIQWAYLPNAGVLRVLFPEGGDAYGMIRRPMIPAVLVEYGYLSNRSEAALFATDEYISAAAIATADAIEAFLDTDRPGTEPVGRPRVFDPARAPSRCEEVPLE